jgi:hypothetical protein
MEGCAQVRGWMSGKYAIYPQNLVLQLENPANVERIQVELVYKDDIYTLYPDRITNTVLERKANVSDQALILSLLIFT